MAVHKKPPFSLSTILTVVLTLIYPFLVFYGLTYFDFRIAALVVLLLFGARLSMGALQGKQSFLRALPLAIAVFLLCLAVWLSRDPRFLLYYPVAVNLLMLVGFAATLKKPPSMIERFARIQEPDLPEIAVAYCRKVTFIWCLFFVLNGTIAAITAAFAPRNIWLLWNGMLSYVAMGLLFAVEWLVRRRVKKRAAESEVGPCLS